MSSALVRTWRKQAMITIVGLENEGGRGRFARHAVGARFLDVLRGQYFASDWVCRSTVEECFFSFGGKGKQVRLLRQREGKLHECGDVLVPHLTEQVPAEIVVAYDEAGLDLGEAEFAHVVRNNGHLGLSSLVKSLGSDAFSCLAIGIGSVPSRDQWEEFFNDPLLNEDRAAVEHAFSVVSRDFEGFLSSYARSPLEDFMIKAQLPSRRSNLLFSPQLVRIDRKEARRIEKAVGILTRILSEVARRYSRLCHEEEHPERYELVRLLEAGVPQEMLSLVRGTPFHIHGTSFDFHKGGQLLEINSAPLPPLVVSKAKKMLGRNGPGCSLSVELLCERIMTLSSRRVKGGGTGKVLLLDKVGEVGLGRTGWLHLVADFLREKGVPVAIGSREAHQDAQVIWANLTWMVPDRWRGFLDDAVHGRNADVFPSPRNFLFTNKYFLTLLSNEEAREVLGINETDAELLDKIIPLTVSSTRRDVLRFALRHGLKLYGKPFLSSGGRGGRPVKALRDLAGVARPAVVQEWAEPYRISGSDLSHDVRVVTYGENGRMRVWQARVWRGDTLERPMDSPIVFT